MGGTLLTLNLPQTILWLVGLTLIPQHKAVQSTSYLQSTVYQVLSDPPQADDHTKTGTGCCHPVSPTMKLVVGSMVQQDEMMQGELSIPIDDSFFWTDSTTVLRGLHTHTVQQAVHSEQQAVPS